MTIFTEVKFEKIMLNHVSSGLYLARKLLKTRLFTIHSTLQSCFAMYKVMVVSRCQQIIKSHVLDFDQLRILNGGCILKPFTHSSQKLGLPECLK